MWAVERIGRKPLLVWGGLIMGIAHVLVYTFIHASVNILAIFSVYLFFFAFASTWGPVSIFYRSKIKIKKKRIISLTSLIL
jgi:MFS transporter, SP family, sugar:H+ symporter